MLKAPDTFLATTVVMFAIAAVVVVYAIKRLSSHPTRIVAVITALAALITAMASLFGTLQNPTGTSPAEPVMDATQAVIR
jgi:hypothetical protein